VLNRSFTVQRDCLVTTEVTNALALWRSSVYGVVLSFLMLIIPPLEMGAMVGAMDVHVGGGARA